jgi:hypothetical protein
MLLNISIQGIAYLLFLSAILGSVGVYLGYFIGFKKISEWRLFKGAEKRRINQLRSGSEPVIIEGTVKPTEQHGLIESPLTGEECVAYRYRIQKDEPGAEADDTTTIERGSESVPFYIEAEHDRVYVEPENASISMEDEYENSGDIKPEKLSQSSFLGIDLSSRRNIEYIENEIEVEQKGIVLGRATDTRMDADFKIEETGDQLVVSDTDPSSTQKRLLYEGVVLTIVGGVFSLATLFIFYIIITGIL